MYWHGMSSCAVNHLHIGTDDRLKKTEHREKTIRRLYIALQQRSYCKCMYLSLLKAAYIYIYI